MSPFSRGTGPQGDPLAVNQIFIRLAEKASRRGTPAVAGTVLVISLLGFAVLPRVPFIAQPAPSPRTEAQARQRQGQMARLPQWRELRRQARARTAVPHSAATPPQPDSSHRAEPNALAH